MNILQILPSLQCGGAERVSVNLANQWQSWGHNPRFALMDKVGEFIDLVYPTIPIDDLRCRRIRDVSLRLSSYLRRCQPDVTLVYMWPLTSVSILSWYLAGCPGKLFLCEHTILSEQAKPLTYLKRALLCSALRLNHMCSTGVIAVSKGVASDLARLAGHVPSDYSVIYNPVVQLSSPLLPSSTFDEVTLWRKRFQFTIVSTGMLIDVKNHDLLLEAFSKVTFSLNASLTILGDGPLLSHLVTKIKSLGLQDRVLLPGYVSSPISWLHASDLFVLSSNYEGFGNVIIEALAAGLPVVSTACPFGPIEILEHGVHGYLVPPGDANALSSAIQSALHRTWDPYLLKQRSLDFSIPRQSKAYLDLFLADKYT